ncbi:hypothetical protein ACB092_05G181600 [Castanea dentata]
MDFSSFFTSLRTSFVIFVVLMLLFTWLSRKPVNNVAISSTEKDIIAISGIDTAVYFVFLRTVLGILILSGTVLLPVLLPIAAKSPHLWAILIATYWVSFVTYYLLWKVYKHVPGLRAYALISPEVKPEQFAVLVRDIPPFPVGQTRKSQVDSFFKIIYPEKFYSSMVVTKNKERCYMLFCLHCLILLSEQNLGRVRTEAIYAESKTTGKPKGVRPTNRIGFLGLIGKKVDSVEYYNEKIIEPNPKLEMEQKDTRRDKQQDSALVFFTSKVIAASAAQRLQAQYVYKWTKIPQDVIYVMVAVTIIFFMIPFGFNSDLMTLENLKIYLPFSKSIVNLDAIKTVLDAFLSQPALMIFLALLLQFLLFLSMAEGILSESHVVRAASGKYFYFIVFDVFIGVLLNATFFLTYVALVSFVGYGLELSRIVPLIIYHLKRKYLCKTESELKEAWLPGDVGYGTCVPSDMLVFTIVLCYSVMGPIIIPFGVAYFGLGWLILRNQTLIVYVASYESYGRMWPHMHKPILAALILYQVTMLGSFGMMEFYYAPFLIPLIILSLIFGFACDNLKKSPNMEQVFRSYILPSLNSENIDDDQF